MLCCTSNEASKVSFVVTTLAAVLAVHVQMLLYKAQHPRQDMQDPSQDFVIVVQLAGIIRSHQGDSNAKGRGDEIHLG